jgi:hypothetical protein
MFASGKVAFKKNRTIAVPAPDDCGPNRQFGSGSALAL